MKPIPIHPPDDEHPWYWCEWGPLDNGDPRPELGQVGPLMIITPRYLRKLINEGPQDAPWEGVHSATVDGRRIFAHHDWNGQRWTWELHPAYFSDNEGPQIIVGRWPD